MYYDVRVGGLGIRMPAEVLIKRKKKGRTGDSTWEVVRAKGHLDEVQELRKGGSSALDADAKDANTLVLTGEPFLFN